MKLCFDYKRPLDEEQRPSLAALQGEGLPRCRAEDIARGEAIAMQALDGYLAIFLPPSDCPCCGSVPGGVLGSFEWGIAHGEGSCSRCGWPMRAYHSIAIDDDPRAIRLQMILAYHPDVLEMLAKP